MFNPSNLGFQKLNRKEGEEGYKNQGVVQQLGISALQYKNKPIYHLICNPPPCLLILHPTLCLVILNCPFCLLILYPTLSLLISDCPLCLLTLHSPLPELPPDSQLPSSSPDTQHCSLASSLQQTPLALDFQQPSALPAFHAPSLSHSTPTSPMASTSSTTLSTVNLRSVFNAPLSKPPTAMEVQVATHLVKRMFHSTSECGEGRSLKLPMGGQVRCTQRLLIRMPYTII